MSELGQKPEDPARENRFRYSFESGYSISAHYANGPLLVQSFISASLMTASISPGDAFSGNCFRIL